MWNSNHHYNLLQQGAGKYEDSEESEVSSKGTESFQGETENLEPWSLMKPRKAMRPRLTH